MSSYVLFEKNRHTGFVKLISGLLKKGDDSLYVFERFFGNTRLITNFARGLVEFKPRSDDIFIVTYPRSGTTWMQMILYQLMTDGEMSFEHISDVSPWFERSLAVGTMQASDFEALSSPRVFKSHLPFCWIPKGAKYIYITRNGMDVLVSYYHFYCSHLGYRGTIQEFADLFINGRVQYRSWFKHVAGWRQHIGDSRIMFVDYERMLDSMESCVRKVADFCGLEIKPDRFSRILDRCSFSYMKKHEAKFDHITGLIREKGWKSKSFIRKGGVGGGNKLLNEKQKNVFRDKLVKSVSFSGCEWRLSDFLH